MGYTIKDNRVVLDKVGRTKKLTATRFATVMGLNAWSTPFEAWCEVTKTYAKPFEETIYTKAGNVIEPKICDYLRRVYFLEINSPTDVYGKDYFKKTWGDFFPDQPVLGGMWDFIGDDFVVEVKTTKRAEDWANDIPIYYKLQAALYAHLLGFNHVIVTATFLEDKDYVNPDNFVPSADNTKIYEFDMREHFPDFESRYVSPALAWWNDHVVSGISPEFDEKKDAEILKVLCKNTMEVDDKDVESLLKEADKLMVKIEKHDAKIESDKVRLKEIDDSIKSYMSQNFRDGDKNVEIESNKYKWTLTKANRASVDSAALKKDGLYEKYAKSSETLTLKKTIKEDK